MGGGGLYEILLLLLISSIEAFYRSDCEVMSLWEMCSIPSTSGVSILSLLTPSTLLIGWRCFGRLAFSLAFSVVTR